MDPTDFFASKRVAIVGMGLMGGSLAMAIKGKCKEIYGIDPDRATLELAQQKNIVDKVSSDPAILISDADVIVLAAPVLAIIQFLGNLPSLHPGNPIVIDLGSTKVEIMRAMESLPDRFDPIGGHPMCGKEKSSLVYADPSIYLGAAFALVPLNRTSPQALFLAEELVRMLGAVPVRITADHHDHLVAYTSHLPYLIASALISSLPEEAIPWIGPGFRSTTRLAGSSTKIMQDILQTNREPVLSAIRQFREQISILEDLLGQGNDSLLADQLEKNEVSYRRLIEDREKGGPQ